MARLGIVGLIAVFAATGSQAASPKIADRTLASPLQTGSHKADHRTPISSPHTPTLKSTQPHSAKISQASSHKVAHQQPALSPHVAPRKTATQHFTPSQHPVAGAITQPSAAPPAVPGFCADAGAWARRDGMPIEVKAKIHTSCRTGDRIVLPSSMVGLIKLACDQNEPLTPLSTPSGSTTSCILAP